MSAEEKTGSVTRWQMVLPYIVWVLRLSVGALFIMSGLVKGIDVWGTVFKFEEYLASWAVELPVSLIVLGAMALCSIEFILGAMLALGCFRRVSVILLLAMMAVMLPLTLYVWIADPVSDCGCFGDFWILSNAATFWKNVLITCALVFLLIYNSKVNCLYNPYSQWICGVLCLVLITCVELYGYNIQPMVDFRSFPAGTSLLADYSDDDESSESMTFIYEKDGQSKEFSMDALPDSTWTFVERKIDGVSAAAADDKRSELAVFDEDGEDITLDVITGSGLELLVVVPQYDRADIYYTSFTNELNEMMNRIGGSLVELTDLSYEKIDSLRNGSMAEFPIYRAESTVLKELSRGVVSVVFLRDGVIQWKRNMGTMDIEGLVKSPNPEVALEMSAPGGGRMLRHWAEALIAVLLVILAIDKCAGAIINRLKGGKEENKSVNLQNEIPGESSDEHNNLTN